MRYSILLIILASIQSTQLIASNFEYKHSKVIDAIIRSADEHNVPRVVLLSICFYESSFKVKAFHKDDGADDSVGVCQIQPATAETLGFKGNKAKLFKLEVNSYLAGKYLRHLINRYGSVDKAIVAYNLGHYSPNYKRYVKKVKSIMKIMRKQVSGV